MVELAHLRGKIEARRATVCVVGLGYVGTCIAAVTANAGFRVVGVDVREEVVKAVSEGRPPFYEPGLSNALRRAVRAERLSATISFEEAVKESDVVIVTVGTPVTEEGEVDLSQLERACESIGKHLSPGKLVVIKSTVPPGTTEGIVREILEKSSGLQAGIDFALAYSPERMAEGKALRELTNLPEIIAGIDDVSTALAESFVKSLGVRAIRLSSPRAAEIAKLASNLWIDLSIALANQLALLCEKFGIDVHEVIKAANTLPRGASYVNILLPGLVGGSCLTKDPYFAAKLAEKVGVRSELIVAARKLNEGMYLHIIRLVQDALQEAGKKLAGSKVAVLGLAYKGETSDTRASQAISIIRELKRLGANVVAYDPYVEKAPPDVKMSDLKGTLDQADCIIVATEHARFREIEPSYIAKLIRAPCAFVDARGIFNPEEVSKCGFIWRGLGRPRGDPS